MKTVKIYSNFRLDGTTKQCYCIVAEPAIVGGFSAEAGEHITTSKVKLIDFERKYLLTQNTTYFWE